MLYTKADGSGGVTNTPQAGWVPITGTDNMTSGTQIGYKPAVMVPGTAQVATPASWTAPGTNQSVTPLVALNTGMLGKAADAAPAPASPAPAPAPAADHENPENANEKSIDVEGPQTYEEAVEGGYLTPDEQKQLSMPEVEKMIYVDPSLPKETQDQIKQSFQMFLIQAAEHGYLDQVVKNIKDNPAQGSAPAGTFVVGANGGVPNGGLSRDLGGGLGFDMGSNVPSSYGDEEMTTLVFHETGHSILGMQHESGNINDTNLPASQFNENFWAWSDDLFQNPDRWGAGTTNPNKDKPHGLRDKPNTPGKAAPGSNIPTGSVAPPPGGPPSNTDPGIPPDTNGDTTTGGPVSTGGPGPSTGPIVGPVVTGGPTAGPSMNIVQPLGSPSGTPGQNLIGGGSSNPLAAAAGGSDFQPQSFGMADLESGGSQESDLPDPDNSAPMGAPPAFDPRDEQQVSFFQNALKDNLARAQIGRAHV